MKKFIRLLLSIICIGSLGSFAKPDNLNSVITETTELDAFRIDSLDNPFNKFIGEWETKENPSISWVVKELITNNSILWLADFGNRKANALWTYNAQTQEVHQLGSNTNGGGFLGKGSFKVNGDLELKVKANADCEHCYRVFHYKWNSKNEYVFKIVSYEKDEEKKSYSRIVIRKSK